MHILGLSAMGHDPAAALLSDNGIVAAIEEGKLARTRVNRHEVIRLAKYRVAAEP